MKFLHCNHWKFGILTALVGVLLVRLSPAPGTLDSDLPRGFGFLLAGAGLLWIAWGCGRAYPGEP